MTRSAPFTIYPAIDLKGGHCVRLQQGRMEDATEYSSDPEAMAVSWQERGATWLHVVDLDGAFSGSPAHLELIRRMVKALTIPVQVGGGIRTDQHIQDYLDAGVRRVIIGTRAFADHAGLAAAVARFGEGVAVGIDARNGMVQVRGWTETTSVRGVDLARTADKLGVRTIIYTDTATDGMLKGPNFGEMETVCRAVSSRVIASGGVSSFADVRRLRDMNLSNLDGCIVGKALYEGLVDLAGLMSEVRS